MNLRVEFYPSRSVNFGFVVDLCRANPTYKTTTTGSAIKHCVEFAQINDNTVEILRLTHSWRGSFVYLDGKFLGHQDRWKLLESYDRNKIDNKKPLEFMSGDEILDEIRDT